MGTTETMGYKRIGGIGMTNNDTLLMEASVDGTAGISFHATGTAEQGNLMGMEETEDNEKQTFTKEDFEGALKKVSRKVKK